MARFIVQPSPRTAYTIFFLMLLAPFFVIILLARLLFRVLHRLGLGLLFWLRPTLRVALRGFLA